MSFVWFDNMTDKSPETAQFFASLFGWQQNDIGSMIMQIDGDKGPFAGICSPLEGNQGWVPYVKVDDLERQTQKAIELGAELVVKNVQGPAGIASFVKDPGGSLFAIWKQNEASA